MIPHPISVFAIRDQSILRSSNRLTRSFSVRAVTETTTPVSSHLTGFVEGVPCSSEGIGGPEAFHVRGITIDSTLAAPSSCRHFGIPEQAIKERIVYNSMLRLSKGSEPLLEGGAEGSSWLGHRLKVREQGVLKVL
jgi:hypothetical protein